MALSSLLKTLCLLCLLYSQCKVVLWPVFTCCGQVLPVTLSNCIGCISFVFKESLFHSIMAPKQMNKVGAAH